MFPLIVSYSALVNSLHLLRRLLGYCSIQKREKIIGHHTRLREMMNLSGELRLNENAAIFNVCALITCEIMRSKDA